MASGKKPVGKLPPGWDSLDVSGKFQLWDRMSYRDMELAWAAFTNAQKVNLLAIRVPYLYTFLMSLGDDGIAAFCAHDCFALAQLALYLHKDRVPPSHKLRENAPSYPDLASSLEKDKGHITERIIPGSAFHWPPQGALGWLIMKKREREEETPPGELPVGRVFGNNPPLPTWVLALTQEGRERPPPPQYH
jgi:hypothetical protein